MVQLLAVVGFNFWVLSDPPSPLKSFPCPGLNCYACPLAAFACPIGSIQFFVEQLLPAGQAALAAPSIAMLVEVVNKVPFYILGVVGVVGALVGRAACGWLCPFGFLQDLLYRVPTPKLRLGNRWGWTRFAVLGLLVIVIPFLVGEPWFCKLCPAGALEAGIPLVILDEGIRYLVGLLYVTTLAILAGTILAVVVVKRAFCRFICPLGALYSLMNRFSAFKLTVDRHVCIECDRCRDVCPTDMLVYENPNDMACVRCLECVRVCPKTAILVE
jgi:polyferredoxin